MCKCQCEAAVQVLLVVFKLSRHHWQDSRVDLRLLPLDGIVCRMLVYCVDYLEFSSIHIIYSIVQYYHLQIRSSVSIIERSVTQKRNFETHPSTYIMTIMPQYRQIAGRKVTEPPARWRMSAKPTVTSGEKAVLPWPRAPTGSETLGPSESAPLSASTGPIN